MATNANKFSYWRRGGAVLPAYAEGDVNGTGKVSYWGRGGVVMYPAFLSANPDTLPGGFVRFPVPVSPGVCRVS